MDEGTGLRASSSLVAWSLHATMDPSKVGATHRIAVDLMRRDRAAFVAASRIQQSLHADQTASRGDNSETTKNPLRSVDLEALSF